MRGRVLSAKIHTNLPHDESGLCPRLLQKAETL